ncbi:hypothetical protein MTP99_010255 [Tenebrio molitor]|nr:hypothetical protein MTP99_010255 [Tenebrio molitor]
MELIAPRQKDLLANNSWGQRDPLYFARKLSNGPSESIKSRRPRSGGNESDPFCTDSIDNSRASNGSPCESIAPTIDLIRLCNCRCGNINNVMNGSKGSSTTY